MGSHRTSVDMHGAMKLLFYRAAFLVVKRPQALPLLGSSRDTEQVTRQVAGHALAWKLHQIRFLLSQSASPPT